MAQTGKKLYELVTDWPTYYIVKEKIPCAGKDPAALIDRLNAAFAGERKDTADGLKIIKDYGWVHLRASNTEPIIRCYAEARTEEQARELANMALKEV
jgi:phosphomannomutase